MSPLNSQMPYKYVASSVSKFSGILFTSIRLTAVACYAAGPFKIRLSFGSQNVPPAPPKPLHKHRRHFVNAHFSQLNNTVLTLLAHDYRLLCSSLSVEISTLAYEANSSCWPETLSVVYCTNIIQTKLMLKNWRYPQNSMFTATGGPTDMPLVVLR